MPAEALRQYGPSGSMASIDPYNVGADSISARELGTAAHAGEQCSPLHSLHTKTAAHPDCRFIFCYSTSIPQAPSARVKDFGFLYKMPVIPRLYAAWALALLSSTKIDSS